MKKTVLEMFFINRHNVALDLDIPRLVYRHCSHIPIYKLKRLASKIDVTLEKLLIDAFVQVLFYYFEEEKVTVVNRTNGCSFAVWEGTMIKDSICEFVKKIKLKKKATKKFFSVDTLAIKFEVKIVKCKTLFSLYYPQDFTSEKFSVRMVYDYEKTLRKMLRAFAV